MEIKVNAPTLPVNMTRMITAFPATLSAGVIPVERPTVPNAETTSNNSCIKLYSGSSTHIKNVATHTTVPESIVIINAFEIFCSDIFLWNACTVPFVHVPLIFWNMIKNVLVLIPPPVDPGEAPINIRIHSTNRPASVNCPIG